jgi:hypothetical protein
MRQVSTFDLGKLKQSIFYVPAAMLMIFATPAFSIPVGYSATDTIIVSPYDPPPYFALTSIGPFQDTVGWTASSTPTANTFSSTIDWGDGTSASVFNTNLNLTTFGTASFIVQHTYAVDGTYGVTFTDVVTGTVGGNASTQTFVTTESVAITPTPLPAALPLFATGLGALGLLGWRRKRKNAAAIAA